MKSQVNEISPVLVEIKVEVPWEKVSSELEDAFRKLQQKARIRGFRQGKAPPHVVRQVLGKSVRSEVAATLVQEGIATAVDEHSLQPVTVPELPRGEPPQITKGEPLTFTARFEVRPKIEGVDTSSLQVERVSETVTEEAIDREIEHLREQNAVLITPDPDRPSRAGDVLLADYKVRVDGELMEDMSANNRQLELGVGRLLPEFEQGLVGLQPGETKQLLVTFPDEHPRQELKGVTAQFEVHVKEVKEKRLPELDDELAKDLGFDTLHSLKSSVRGQMEETARKRAESRLRDQVVDKLVENNPVPVPPTMLERQEQAMLREYSQYGQMIGNLPPLDDEVRKTIRDRAERRVRAALLFNQIARERNLEVTEENVEEKLKQLAESTGKNLAKLRAEYKDDMREALQAQLMEDKLLEYLLSEATITEKAPEPENTSEEASR